ncbi:nucleotide exchange factor GrpE [Prosthecomicrobium hirschii]|uniref:nucleotide exchange factor GrpE n=2 Tax=Prosthecodimorpha hirschii TaxID=665126 RepID=UPI00222119F5|nr:nucleotide exchange factor GrpE [Prosthecomicrobium hirschii]MCW1841174.1 nucleotide exchange factor GrpE [Prosthecomicrobium hirschii]
MSDETRSNTTAADQTEAAAAGAPTPDAAPAETATPDPTEQLRAEHAEMKDRLLRTLAEMENLRRRTEKEIKDARDYAITAFARELLGVSDNLTRAVGALPAEARAAAEAAVTSLIEGVELTGRELAKAMEKHGVRRIEPMGGRFDPNLHQAMFEIPNAEVPSGTVLQVLQDGYVLGDRVLRPALVGVAKGGPKAPAAPAEPAGVDRTA